MSSKVLILSHPKLTVVLRQVIEEMQKLPNVTIKNVDFGDVINYLNTNISSIKPNLIVTAGAHLEMLNQSSFSNMNIPIIPIPVTQFDLLHAALQARQFGKRIAIIHYGDGLIEGENLLKDIDCNFQYYSYHSHEDVVSLISSLKESGIDAIIGAGTVCSLADSFNVPSVFLHSKDTIIRILDHVTRLETARIDMFTTAQKWSIEFLKNPILTYEVDSMIETFKSSTTSLPMKLDYSNSKETQLEEFLFNKKISSYFTKRSKPFFDQNYPYISFGVIEFGEMNIEALMKRLEDEYNLRLFYSVKDTQCRFLLLTTNEFTYTLLNTFLKKNSNHIRVGISTPVTYDLIFSIDENIKNKIFEAKVAFELSKSKYLTQPIFLFDQSNPFTLLFNIAQDRDLPETLLLKPLFGHRNTQKLLDTLRLLLDHGLSVTTVANHLNFSRQTVYALLERIENLVGMLNDPEKRFTLSMELRMLAMKNAISSVKMENMKQVESLTYSLSVAR